MSDDLVERARLAIAAEWGCAQPCQSQPECTCARDARLAVNMALEEAAKMLEARWAYGTADHQAAAIRALVKK